MAMTDKELADAAEAKLQAARAEFKKTTAGWLKPNGQPNYPSGSAPISTHWGKAFDSFRQAEALIAQIGLTPPPPPPPSNVAVSAASGTVS